MTVVPECRHSVLAVFAVLVVLEWEHLRWVAILLVVTLRVMPVATRQFMIALHSS